LYIFNDRNGQERLTASLCQILSKSLKPRRRYVSFRFFKMAAAAMLDFRNFKFLTVGTVKRVKHHQHVKFRQNQSNRGRDMSIFINFSKMAAVRHLGFVMRVCGPPTKGIWWSLSLANLVGIDAVVLIICTFFGFASLVTNHLGRLSLLPSVGR